MQSDTAARVRSAGKAALAPGAAAVAATAMVAGPVPAHADTTAAKAAPAPQPLRAKFRRSNVLFGRRVPVTGWLLTAQPGRKVLLQVNRGHGWDNVDRATTGARGRFRLSFRPHGLGRYRMRVRLVGPVAASSATPVARSAIHTRGRVTVYRSSFASWYGPGFMGGRTACGGTLDAGTLGVANKTLPCGTKVRFYYHGRSVTARVVDRGPYVAGREWDLTPAVKARLGFPSTGEVWSTR
jgi:peptidoglycan lytic transglycosylase